MNPKPKTSANPFPFWRLGLRNKLIAMVIAVGTVPLILAMIFSYLQGNKSLTEVIGSSFQALAYETSTKVDLLLKEEIHKTRHLARHPTLVLSTGEQTKVFNSTFSTDISGELAQMAKAWENHEPFPSSPDGNRASEVLKGFLKDKPDSSQNTRALFVTNTKGILVASINFGPAFLNEHLPSWKKIISGELETFIGPLVKDKKTGQFTFEIALPIKDSESQVVGVLHHILAAKNFFAQSLDNITFGDTGHVMVIDSDGVVLTCPILETGHQLKDRELVKAVTGPDAAWVKTKGDGHGNKDVSIIGYSPLKKTSRIVEASTGKRWFTYAWQSSDELFAPTHNLLSWVLGAAMFSILLIAIMGSMAANKIVQPIRQVQRTAESIGRGETVPPLSIKTGDEIESLADEINTMSRLLQKTFSGLEHQVQTKTQEVIHLKKYTDTILMSVPEVIVILDSNLHIEYANAAFESLTGCGSSEYMGKELWKVELKFQKSWAGLMEELNDYRTGTKRDKKVTSLETTHQETKDPLAPPEEKSQEDSRATITLGDNIFVYQFFDVVLEDKEARRIGLIMKNITEEKKLIDKLTQADKLSGLGTLAAGIAHEMNNPLYSIMGYTEAILDEKKISNIQYLAQKVLDRSKHMASIILNLSGYARTNDKDSFKEVSVNERIEAALEMAMMASLANGITLNIHYGSVPSLKAKPEEIQQVFLNIISNAFQAMEGKGKLTVTTQNNNGFIVARIRDTGPGIPQEYRSKVFDPFFTTKEQGKGTGLGLNIVHRIVEKYGGNIQIESEVGLGTEFVISLPINGKEPS